MRIGNVESSALSLPFKEKRSNHNIGFLSVYCPGGLDWISQCGVYHPASALVCAQHGGLSLWTDRPFHLTRCMFKVQSRCSNVQTGPKSPSSLKPTSRREDHRDRSSFSRLASLERRTKRTLVAPQHVPVSTSSRATEVVGYIRFSLSNFVQYRIHTVVEYMSSSLISGGMVSHVIYGYSIVALYNIYCTHPQPDGTAQPWVPNETSNLLTVNQVCLFKRSSSMGPVFLVRGCKTVAQFRRDKIL
ncbi:hypothetical protein M501DRAFT_319075 [Patellaria atrata CBS 101060]|uniref:Uncharacterized protein n=1 Tax=Patellaria atrata CBS 101060 TaxID=1346257 RepID=A0A9P4VJT3_9PEZI|nr:hypothetical protein M501DRAFT_319075 [Patellaria atrata CBS 101060]